MKQSTSHSPQHAIEQCRIVVRCGLISCLLYLGITWLSRRFTLDIPVVERPLLPVLGLLAAAFVCYMRALQAARSCENQAHLTRIILLFAAAFRAILLFSEPIQEIDLYRYVWDGHAVAAGVSPYRYSPAQVLAASADKTLPDDLRRLVDVRDSSDAIHTILSHIHYGEVATVYPPVSQFVFALASATTPVMANVTTHLLIMKTWILIFDLATILLLLGILRQLHLPIGWCIAYAWCPLVLKEFANSGHLDAIAVCLTTWAVCIVIGSRISCDDTNGTDGLSKRRTFVRCLGAASVFALAIGAKLYPVVLVPWFGAFMVRRIGWSRTSVSIGILLAGAALVCRPMLFPTGRSGVENIKPESNGINTRLEAISEASSEASSLEPPADETATLKQQDPRAGLKTFLTRWMMNDFLFMLTIENLKPDQRFVAWKTPWFVLTSDAWRQRFVETVSKALGITAGRVPFLVARTLTALAFLFLAAWWCWKAFRATTPEELLEAAFLTLAWFWLLLPTQNPWYWIWALPLIPFARSRVWLTLSGFVLIYYLRFWFGAHWPNAPVWHTPYTGHSFYDYVITWLEYGPWFLWLAVAWWRTRRAGP